MGLITSGVLSLSQVACDDGENNGPGLRAHIAVGKC